MSLGNSINSFGENITGNAIDNVANAKTTYTNNYQKLLCHQKIELFNRIAKDITSTARNLGPMVQNAAGTLANDLGGWAIGTPFIPQVNDNIDFKKILTDTANQIVPDCLLSNDDISEVLKNISNKIKQAFGGAGDLLTSMIESVGKSLKSMKKSISNVLAKAVAVLDKVVDHVSSTMKLALDTVSRAAFEVFDAVKNFAEESGIMDKLNKIRDMYDCLTSNCPDFGDLSYSLGGVYENGEFNLPFDEYTGEFRPYKLSRSSDTLADAVIQEKLNQMDLNYSDFSLAKQIQYDKIADRILGGI